MSMKIISSLLLLSIPSVVWANDSASPTTDQSVYRTVETITILNDDGTWTDKQITTVYYLFGYE